jgi:hypothetical protein
MADPKKDRPVGFTPRGARRIAEATQRVLSTPWSGDPRRGRSNTWNPGIARGKVTTAIPTGTVAAPSSSGRAQLYAKDSTGAWVEWGGPVVVYNDHTLTASVAVNKAVKLAWIAGDWWVVSADC